MNAVLLTVVPSMNQIAFCPLAVLRHRMSVFTRPVVAFRVPLNPPTPAIVQLGSASVGRNALLAIVTPFISQMQFCPLLGLRHTMSALPSPAKSPIFTTAQFLSGTDCINELLETDDPFISQMEFSPVSVLRHRISEWPSPSKSPMPATIHAGSATGVIA